MFYGPRVEFNDVLSAQEFWCDEASLEEKGRNPDGWVRYLPEGQKNIQIEELKSSLSRRFFDACDFPVQN